MGAYAAHPEDLDVSDTAVGAGVGCADPTTFCRLDETAPTTV